MNFYEKYCKSLAAVLSGIEVTNKEGKKIRTEQAFGAWSELSIRIQSSNRHQFLCGNGASAAFANHMALDWTKNGHVKTIAFSDSALLTAMGNDFGGDEIFSASLRLYAEPEDLLVTISSSGNSPNILKAIETASKLGMRVVTLSGLKPDNCSRSMGELNFYLPAKTYGLVECCHQVLLHAWLDHFMGIAEWNRETYQNMRSDSYQL